MITVHLIVKGRVQGVGYRYFCLRSAREIGITGTVKNNFDGSVEVYASGEEDELNEFIKILSTGPRTASNIEVQRSDLKEARSFNDFSIVG